MYFVITWLTGIDMYFAQKPQQLREYTCATDVDNIALPWTFTGDIDLLLEISVLRNMSDREREAIECEHMKGNNENGN